MGGGFEWAFARNLSAKLEYLYYDLGAVALTNANINPLAFTNIVTGALQVADATMVSTRFNGHVLRAGLNYRFDWSEPAPTGSAATPLFASPQFAAIDRPSFGDWRFKLMPYMWAMNTNGAMTARGHTVGTDTTVVDAYTKSSSFPLTFMGRFEARNGPVSFYGDLAWVQLRFSGSTLKLRSPTLDIGLAVSASGRLKQTMAIGEAGAGYELARWTLAGAPDTFTALDAYAGLRYWYIGLDLSLDVVGAVNSQLLGVDLLGAKAIAKSGNIQWIDPVIGLGLRHQFAPGEEFQFRGDIGGFSVGSKFSWQTFGAYNHNFSYAGYDFTSTMGYRALSVDYSDGFGNRRRGIDAIIHGPVMAASLRF